MLILRSVATIAAPVLALALIACGRAPDGSGDATSALAACHALCDVEEMGAGCTVAGACRSECTSLIAQLPADCDPVAQAYWTCAKAETWTCGGHEDFRADTMDVTCAAEAADFSACLASLD